MNRDLAEYIVRQSIAEGVDPTTALAFAFAESGVENVVGDRELHRRDGYMDAVRRQHEGNPALDEPSAWVSYGPFQLQARWFVPKGQHPRVLLRPELSVPLALRYIRRQLGATGGDVLRARIRYVCGSEQNCSEEKREKIVRRFEAAAERAEQYMRDRDGDGDPLEEEPSRNLLLAGLAVAFALKLVLEEKS